MYVKWNKIIQCNQIFQRVSKENLIKDLRAFIHKGAFWPQKTDNPKEHCDLSL